MCSRFDRTGHKREHMQYIIMILHTAQIRHQLHLEVGLPPFPAHVQGTRVRWCCLQGCCVHPAARACGKPATWPQATRALPSPRPPASLLARGMLKLTRLSTRAAAGTRTSLVDACITPQPRTSDALRLCAAVSCGAKASSWKLTATRVMSAVTHYATGNGALVGTWHLLAPLLHRSTQQLQAFCAQPCPA